MSCEAWTWLAIGTGAIAIVGHLVYLTAVGGYPTGERSGVVALFSVVVYLVHCVS